MKRITLMIAILLFLLVSCGNKKKEIVIKNIAYPNFNYAVECALQKKSIVSQQPISIYKLSDGDTIISGVVQDVNNSIEVSGSWKSKNSIINGTFIITNTNDSSFSLKPKECSGLIVSVKEIDRYTTSYNGIPAAISKKSGAQDYSLIFDDPEDIRKQLQRTTYLEFWETYDNTEIQYYLIEANAKIKEINNLKRSENKTTSEAETTAADELAREYPLFSVLNPYYAQDGRIRQGAAVGFVHVKDTATVNAMLNEPQVKALFPSNLKLLWSVKSFDDGGNYLELIAVKGTGSDCQPALSGNIITDAWVDYVQEHSISEVTISMNAEGAREWARITKENIGKSVAIVLDNYVYSYPTVQTEIKGGRASITGNFTIAEANNLANRLKSGNKFEQLNIEDLINAEIRKINEEIKEEERINSLITRFGRDNGRKLAEGELEIGMTKEMCYAIGIDDEDYKISKHREWNGNVIEEWERDFSKALQETYDEFGIMPDEAFMENILDFTYAFAESFSQMYTMTSGNKLSNNKLSNNQLVNNRFKYKHIKFKNDVIIELQKSANY